MNQLCEEKFILSPKHQNQERNDTMTKETKKQADNHNGNHANRDPLTATPGVDPKDTGVGAAGAVRHARSASSSDWSPGQSRELVGKAFAETMDTTVEDAYWMTNYSKQNYEDSNAPYTRQ